MALTSARSAGSRCSAGQVPSASTHSTACPRAASGARPRSNRSRAASESAPFRLSAASRRIEPTARLRELRAGVPAEQLGRAGVGPGERVVAHHGERPGAHARAGRQPERLVERAEAGAVRKLEAPTPERDLAALAQERALADVVDARADGPPLVQKRAVEAFEGRRHGGGADARTRPWPRPRSFRNRRRVRACARTSGPSNRRRMEYHCPSGGSSLSKSSQLKVSGGTPSSQIKAKPIPPKISLRLIKRKLKSGL